MTAATDQLVWYVAYGSNLLRSRLGCYLAGGRPTGAARTYVGCRDTRPPRKAVPIRLSGGLVFAAESSVWGGGIAVHEPQLPGSGWGLAYLVTFGQLSDLVAQETRQRPGADLMLDDEGRIGSAAGLYDTLHLVGERETRPMYTLATRRAPAPNAPSASYLRVLMAGLAEAFAWDLRRRLDYVLSIPGARPTWTRQRLQQLSLGSAAGRPHPTGSPASASDW